MARFEIIARIPFEKARSLVWSGDCLVDWAHGGDRLDLDGTVFTRPVYYAYSFDAACTSPSGDYAVIYTRLGTKGLVLHRGKILREINRSFYHAAAYDYPVAIGRLANGREVLVHCPEHYNRLEIDDIATGERLTLCEERQPPDIFHSRLSFSPASGRFLSAGWIWHPIDDVRVYPIEETLADPRVLDQVGMLPAPGTEISSAAFLDEDRVAFWTSEETFCDEEDFADPGLIRPSHLTLWDLNAGKAIHSVGITEPVGTTMTITPECVVGFHCHPKLIDFATGKVVERMESIDSGKQVSSICREPLPPMAIDA
jgi:hypothetical protein